MSCFTVYGGVPLSGSVPVYGAKNAILPILAACIMTEEEVILENCPHLSDVGNMLEILRLLGCEAVRAGSEIRLYAKHADSYEMPEALSKKMRSSIFMLGALISRFGKAKVTQPGGCEIGLRPIDLHLKGLRALQVQISETHGEIHCDGTHARGAEITLDYPSVGATENIIMAAVTARGVTVLHNAAREPEVADLAQFINQMGGRIEGAGTGTVKITGVEKLNGVRYAIMPDRIVAGTYLAAAAITGGNITLTNICPAHLQAAASKLQETGCEITFTKNSVHLLAPKRLCEMQKIETLPYPGFPTDLRGGAALVIAGLAAEGKTVVEGKQFIDRGYENLARELGALGAEIQ